MKLKIFNLNCWLLPFFFSINNKKRLGKIIALIKKINPDIITLQEVWLSIYVAELQKMLSDYTFTSSNPSFFNRAGLVIGVKRNMPVTNHPFIPTKEYSLVEKWGGKGYQILHLPENILLLNTHLYASTKVAEENIAKIQFGLLSSVIGIERGILVGDLNIEQNDFLKINNIFQYTPSPDYTLVKTNMYANVGRNNTPYSKKIDYVLGSSGLYVTEEIISDDTLSDHFPIIGTIEY